MIRLQDFVSETLKEIVDGVVAAQKHACTLGAKVSPTKAYTRMGDNGGVMTEIESGRPIQFVHFDVAITATEGTEAKGGLGVFVGPIGIGSQGRADKETSVVSRIVFDVPVLLPGQE